MLDDIKAMLNLTSLTINTATDIDEPKDRTKRNMFAFGDHCPMDCSA